ncbi:MAG: ATP-binding protein [Ilumatobacteraceae bacterium]
MDTKIAPMTGYLRRTVDSELDQLLLELTAVSLDGPKGIGKTSTARQRGKTHFELDDPATLEVVRADQSRLVTGKEPIIIDEWQRFPSSWDVVRRAVDADPRPGRFILTGSASPKSPPTHSGAGRIVTVRMRPFTLAERQVEQPTVSMSDLLTGSKPAIQGRTSLTLKGYVTEIMAGGFPAMRMPLGRAHRATLDGYLNRIVDHDFPEAGQAVRKPDALKRWMIAYAAATATTASFETIRDAATSGQREKPAKTTTIPYREMLKRLWIVDPIPAWLPTNNHLTKLTFGPKHHLADPALAARLLGISAEALLSGKSVGPTIPREGTLLGCLFESLVALSVRVFAQASEARVHHLRTKQGDREIDFIVVRPDQRVLALEVKLSQVVNDNDVRHLNWLANKIGPDLLDAAVITTGPDAYRRADGIAVIPAALLGP